MRKSLSVKSRSVKSRSVRSLSVRSLSVRSLSVRNESVQFLEWYFFSGSCFKKFWSPINTIHVKYLPTYISSTEPKICADDYASVGRTVCDDHAECLEGDGAIACQCKEGALGDGWAISSGCVPGTNVLKHLKIIGLVFVYSIGGRLSSKTVFLLQMKLLCKSRCI